MQLLAHPGGWWELLIPLVIGFGLVFSFAMRRARGRADDPEDSDSSYRRQRR